MKKIKSLFEFYIHGNIHVALSVWSMAQITGLYFDFSPGKSSLFLALATFLSYNFIRYVKYKNKDLQNHLYAWFSLNKTILLWINVLVGIAFVYLVFQFNLQALLVLIPFGVATLLYMLPVLKWKGTTYSFRKIPGFKIFCIAISWSGVVVFFPIQVHSMELGSLSMLFFLLQFLFVLLLTLPFDIRDVNFDDNGLKTIPQWLGLNYSKILGFSITLIIAFLQLHYFYKTAVIMLFGTILASLFLFFSKPNQSKYYASFWVEAVPIFTYLFGVLFL